MAPGPSPRGRGSHPALVARTSQTDLGLSPRARGTSSPTSLASPVHPKRMRSLSRVHPRMRGCTTGLTCQRLDATGSSPHARVIRIFEIQSASGEWFIPACAGATGGTAIRLDRGLVHPRMRGSSPVSDFRRTQGAGSSPRATFVRRSRAGRETGTVVLKNTISYVLSAIGSGFRSPPGFRCDPQFTLGYAFISAFAGRSGQWWPDAGCLASDISGFSQSVFRLGVGPRPHLSTLWVVTVRV